MTAAILWVRAHKAQLGIAAGALAALAGAFWAGRATAPQPEVELHQEVDRAAFAAQQEDRQDVYGPVHARVVLGASPCAPATATPPQPSQGAHARQGPPQTLAEAIAELPPGSTLEWDQGPSSEASHAASQSSSQEQQRTDLRVSPASRSRWALGAGIEDPLGARRLQVVTGFRVIGPVWLRAAFTPTRGAPGMTIGGEVQW